MLFFNYKLVIILGISVVLYFIYREVDSLHYRLENLENRLNTLDYNQSDKQCDITYLSAKEEKHSCAQETNDSNHLSQLDVKVPNLFKNNTKQIIIDFNKSHHLNDPMFQIFAMQKATDYVEVYSNDNSDKNITTLSVNSPHNVTQKNTSPKVSSPKVSSPKVSSSKISSPKISSPKVSSPKVSSPKVSSPKVSSPKVSSPKVSSPNVSSEKVTSPKNVSPKVSSEKVTSPKNVSPKVSSPDNTSIQVFDAKVNYKTLSMNDLSKIALENNINLLKVVDGKSKKKVKQELVNEIISKKNI